MREETGKTGPWGAAAFAAALLAAALVYFFPFFFQGRHMVPFHYEPSQATGIPEGGAPPSIYRKFPGGDNSPIMIHYPNASFVGACLRRGELPLWNPFVGCGTPGLASGQIYPLSPFQWPFFANPNPWTYTFGLILGCIWSALGFYLWLGGFGTSPWQRTLGALLATFNSWTIRIIICSNVWAAWWLGWLLWSWDRAIQRDTRSWWMPALFVTGMVYCGHPEEALLLTAGSAAYALAVWALARGSERLSFFALAGRVSGIAGLAGLLTAPHTLPLLARLGDTFSYKFDSPERVTPDHYSMLAILNPRTVVYVSPVLMGMVILGLGLLGRSGPTRKLWAVFILLVVAFIMCFRPLSSGPFAQVLSAGGLIPGIYARSLFWAALVTLAAVGAGRLLAGGAERWTASRQFLLGLAAFAALSWGSYLYGAMVHLLLRKDLIALYALTAVLFLGAILIPRRALRTAMLMGGAILVAASFFMEPGPGLKFYEIFNRDDPTAGGPPAIRDLRAKLTESSHARFSAAMTTTTRAPDLSPDLASLWRVRDVRLVDALVERRFAALEVEMLPKKPPFVATWFAFQGVSPRDLGLLGVRFFAVPENAQQAQFRWDEIPDALPRAYLVHKVVPARDEEDSLRRWRSFYPTDAAYDSAVVEGWVEGSEVGRPDPQDRVEWVEDGVNRVSLKATTATGGVLVLLDTYASGWRASIDGRPSRIYPANLAFRAVEVPSGSHEVDFLYRPRAVLAGLALSGAGWLAVLALAVWAWKRKG